MGTHCMAIEAGSLMHHLGTLEKTIPKSSKSLSDMCCVFISLAV